MNLIAVDVEAIKIGRPLPFELRTESGVLLARKGYVLESRDEIAHWKERGIKLCADMDADEDRHRAYVGKLHELVRAERPLGELEHMQISPDDMFSRTPPAKPERTDWLALQARAHALLRDTDNENFLDRLERLHAELDEAVLHHPDAALLALIHLTATELRMYSATHALLVHVVCRLAASEVLQWPAEHQQALGRAALTMNCGMTALQDTLAAQTDPLTNAQIEALEQHPQRSSQRLRDLGVTDENWLLGVRHHHDRAPGPLAQKTPAQRIARLIQRADMFTCRLAPRITRPPMSQPAAMQSCYFDEQNQVDEAGAALIKAVGVYSPGLYVRLANGEIAAVIQRGINTSAPRVAAIVNRQGMPMGELCLRDTSLPQFKIAGSVPSREMKVKVGLDRLLALL